MRAMLTYFGKRFARSTLTSMRRYLQAFVERAAESIPDGALVLDAGAGKGPYRSLFDHAQYESADFCQVEQKEYDPVTYVCDLTKIPVEDDRYDLVMLTQVLEHVPEPRKLLEEMHRVLKPGAALWLSAPLFHQEHEQPYDFFRYTQFGFNHLLTQAGFTVESIEWLEGYCGTLSYQFRWAAKYLPGQPKHYGGGIRGLLSAAAVFLLRPCFVLLSLFFMYADIRHKYVDSGHCMNYAVVARKPAIDGPAKADLPHPKADI